MYEGKRILIAQPIIRGYNGSTMVTFELAKYLQSLGMDVTIYTCDHADPAKSYFKKNKLKVDTAQDSPSYQLQDFDYVWVHSQIIPPSLIKALSQKLPSKIPTFIFLHMSGMDWIPDEKPWIYNLENRLSSLSLFISEEVKNVNLPFLNQDVSTDFFRNPAPICYQHRKPESSSTLSKLLIVSNHLPHEVLEASNILRDKYHIQITSLGEGLDDCQPFTLKILEKYDAVLTIAKTVPYCLVSGTPVYVYDTFGGGPGWLSEDNFTKAKERNFSGYQNDVYPNYEGGVFHRKTASEIASEIIKGYTNALSFHRTHCQSFLSDYSIDHVIPRIFSSLHKRKITPFSKEYSAAITVAEQFATVRFETGGALFIRDDHIRTLEKQLRNQEERIRKLEQENNELVNYKKTTEEIFNSGAYRAFNQIIRPYKKLIKRSKNG